MSEDKPKRERSPAFPFIPLQTAIKRLEELEATFGRHPAPANKAGLAWKMKETSSQAAQTLAALNHYGLVNYHGSGDRRTASLSEDARIFLRAHQSSIKQEVLQHCALKPKALYKYWNKWGSERPPTPVCMDQLVIDDGYTLPAATTFLKVYDQTISFAGLSDSDKMDEVSLNETEESQEEMETSSTSTPLSSSVSSSVAKQLAPNSNEREEMRGPLSSMTSYRLLVSGDWGPKEITNLIRMLETQKAILSDEETKPN